MSVDHDLLADYVGGALEGTPEQERVAGLIATSTEWGRAADELTAALHGVQNDLNVLRETPEPMPDDLAARFEGLFDGPRRDPLSPHVVTPRSRRAGRAKRWKRWAAPVVIVAAVLGFFGLGQVPSLVTPMLSEDAGSARNSEMAADAPAAAPPGSVPTAATWRLYDRNNLLGTFSAGVPFASTDTAQESGAVSKGSDRSSSEPLARLRDPIGLQQCLSTVAAVLPGSVTFVEYAYFEGSPALVISITSADGQWRFVAGANCGQLGPDERYRTQLK